MGLASIVAFFIISIKATRITHHFHNRDLVILIIWHITLVQYFPVYVTFKEGQIFKDLLSISENEVISIRRQNYNKFSSEISIGFICDSGIGQRFRKIE